MSVKSITPNAPANFTPSMGDYKTLEPFRYWCQKVLPLVYDDSLSYYELLCKVVDYLNKTMEDVETLHGDVTNLHTAYAQLQDYVNNYFASLDVQQEINNKLDSMASDGSLLALISPLILNTLPPLIVDSVSEMTNINRTYILKGNSHIYQNLNGIWTDTGVVFGGTIGNVVTYLGTISTDVDNLSPQTIYIISNTETPNIPEKTTGFIYTYGDTDLSRQQLFTVFSSGVTYYRTRDINKNWSVWQLQALTYCGILTHGSDLNSVSVQTIYLCSAPVDYQNVPTTNTGFVYTVGENTGSTEQFYVGFTSGKTYFRQRNIGGTWGEWSSNSVYYSGILDKQTDLNSIDVQTIYLCASPIDYPNAPTTESGFVYTVGENTGSAEQFYVGFTSGKTYFRQRNIGGTWGEWSSNSVYYSGILEQKSDFNKLTIQSAYLCVAPIDYLNIPLKVAGIVYTIGTSTNAQQFYVTLANGFIYYRNRNYLGNWSDWKLNTDKNANSKLYSIGNSILTGSVWVNGNFDHLSSYGNAPYSVVANAISIPEQNVTHRLISSTGFMYDAGNGSFLENIKKVNLSPYDALLTHFYWQDMNANFPIGNENSISGDGSLAGGVLELLDYIKSSNSMCQLILVSVVPVSSEIYGENVFTGVYPNGSSIAQFDELMEKLANKHHFTFINWQDLNISYNYHDYTDGLNVHANNENTYRIMGAYLGGRASSKLNF